MTNSKSILRQRIITVFSFLAIAITINGQESNISQSTGGAYFYEGKTYEIQDLGAVLYENGEAFVLYNEGKQKYTSAKTLGIVSIAGFGAGILSLSLVERSGSVASQIISIGPNVMFTGMGIVFIGTGIVTGVSALTKRTRGLMFMENAIRKFNSKTNPTAPQPNLQVSVTGNGAGLVLTF